MSKEKTETKESSLDDHRELPLIQVFAALGVLTIIEVGIGYIPSSPLVTTVLLLLALVKAILVGAVFMEIAYDKQAVRIVLIVFVVPFIAALLLIVVINSDWRNVIVA